MTITRNYHGGASVTALCAICTGGAYDRRQPRPHALPLRGRRHPADHQQHAPSPAVAGDAVAADHRPLCARLGCAAPGREYRRQLDAHTNNRRTRVSCPFVVRFSRVRFWRGMGRCIGNGRAANKKYNLCWRWSAHGHHQPLLQRLHLAPHGLTAGRGWAV